MDSSQLGLVIVDDFDIPGPSICPNKANAVLVVYSNAELPRTRTSQSLETIAWWTIQVA